MIKEMKLYALISEGKIMGVHEDKAVVMYFFNSRSDIVYGDIIKIKKHCEKYLDYYLVPYKGSYIPEYLYEDTLNEINHSDDMIDASICIDTLMKIASQGKLNKGEEKAFIKVINYLMKMTGMGETEDISIKTLEDLAEIDAEYKRHINE